MSSEGLEGESVPCLALPPRTLLEAFAILPCRAWPCSDALASESRFWATSSMKAVCPPLPVPLSLRLEHGHGVSWLQPNRGRQYPLTVVPKLCFLDSFVLLKLEDPKELLFMQVISIDIFIFEITSENI